MPHIHDQYEANLPHKHIALVYFARTKNDTYKISDEHSELHWLDEADIDDPKYGLSKSVKFYCKEAIKASLSQ